MVAMGLTLLGALPAQAAPKLSRCLAVAQNLSPFVRVSYQQAELASNQVRITFVGHSTFRIETPEGITIATDYAGYAGRDVVPDVVTMNHAHSSHYTNYPDPRIPHVLRGWNPAGGHAEHNLEIKDVFIRNVPTNIRSWVGGTEEFGNSIFIFEVAGLCIGHLGHLHHEPTDQQLSQIGQLDIVMAPVDGSYTLDVPGMMATLKQLHTRIVFPMHYFGPTTLERFLSQMRENFDVRFQQSPTIVVSQATMPEKPEIIVLPGY